MDNGTLCPVIYNHYSLFFFGQYMIYKKTVLIFHKFDFAIFSDHLSFKSENDIHQI